MTHIAIKTGLAALAAVVALGGAASAEDARHGNWQGQRKPTTTVTTTSRPAVSAPVTATRTTTVTQRTTTATAPSWVGSRPHQEAVREPEHGTSGWHGGHGRSQWGHGWRGWRHWGWW